MPGQGFRNYHGIASALAAKETRQPRVATLLFFVAPWVTYFKSLAKPESGCIEVEQTAFGRASIRLYGLIAPGTNKSLMSFAELTVLNPPKLFVSIAGIGLFRIVKPNTSSHDLMSEE